jgi:4-hydroxythreonine-4-phosphate dehydrogenase
MVSRNNPTFRSKKIRVCVTLGDPSGIGPAIAAKALAKLRGLADFTLIGSGACFSHPSLAKLSHVKFIDLKNVKQETFVPGKVRAEYGRASIDYIDRALELLKNDDVDCLVTCPVSKEAVNLSGVKFCGHTEYLAKKTSTKFFEMLLMNRLLKISLATRHIPIKGVSKEITQQGLYKNILITYLGLKRYFGILHPKLVICGLNPHASDNGLIGKEENAVIRPTIEKLRYARIYVHGPVSSDVAMRLVKDAQFDCAVAMYHDQALIPLKLTGGLSGSNLTLGLPFVRTSPLHGTAFDIASKPQLADPSSLIESIKAAIECTRNLKKA